MWGSVSPVTGKGPSNWREPPLCERSQFRLSCPEDPVLVTLHIPVLCSENTRRGCPRAEGQALAGWASNALVRILFAQKTAVTLAAGREGWRGRRWGDRDEAVLSGAGREVSRGRTWAPTLLPRAFPVGLQSCPGGSHGPVPPKAVPCATLAPGAALSQCGLWNPTFQS